MSSSPERKALFLRDMPIELVREAKAVAARRGKTLTTIVSEALTASLGLASAPPDPALELRRDMEWYRKHKSQLLARYRDQYIAIVDGAVIDHAPDFQTLARRVFARHGQRGIYMPRVQPDAREPRIRSPKRSRS